MGATNSRFEDAALLLAVPKFTMIGKRRMLDTSAKKCFVCAKSFGFLRKKHYCRRCGRIVCDECTTMRKYKQRVGHGFRVCDKCNCIPVINIVPQAVWHRILSFSGNTAHHNTIQVCRKAQLSVPLPFPWGETWDAFFTEGTFLSKGANGSVFRTTLRSDAKRTTVAVKVIQKNSIYSLRKWHHIQREIDALKACRHPHVIELVNVMQSPECVYIVLQFAHGGDLFDWLVSRKAPSEVEVKPIAAQLMSTLAYMHDICGAVHRDIKPENILLEKKVKNDVPHIRLADFGFARVFPQVARGPGMQLAVAQKLLALDITVAATPCGTLGFAAPEIIVAYSNQKQLEKDDQELRKKSPVKPPSAGVGNANAADDGVTRSVGPITPIEMMRKMDIFAAGVTLCILLTGCEPFPCHSSKAHLDAVNEGCRFEGRHWLHVSAEAKELLRLMLHPHAGRRPSALECLQSKWLRNVSTGKSSLAASSATQQLAARRPEEESEIVASFQQSIKSLRKNDGMMLMTDKKTGTVQRRQRPGVLEDTLNDEPPLAQQGESFRTATSGQTPYMSRRSEEPSAEEVHVGSLHEQME
jgi:serine/threonine protein kinase